MHAPPTGIKLIRAERVVAVTWGEEGTVRYPARRLRCECRCAQCQDERTGVRTLDVSSVPEDIGITDVQLVGNYAVKFVFSDGHDTGIYSWDRLYAIKDAE